MLHLPPKLARVEFRCERPLLEQLQREAVRQGLTVSQLLRMAANRYLLATGRTR